jgi:hypothetical protein
MLWKPYEDISSKKRSLLAALGRRQIDSNKFIGSSLIEDML